jgi:FMN phosphatase YigB (HAD superfamily)
MTAARPKALIIDWIGVLTTGFEAAATAWACSEDLDPGAFLDALAEVRQADLGEQAGSALIQSLERGEIGPEPFERALASRLLRLSGVAPEPNGLLQRLFGHFDVKVELLTTVRKVRRLGYRTALLSNSWGNNYPRALWEGAFDHALISGEIGMRKPQAEVYAHAAGLLGVAPGDTVFVDDMPQNVAGAERAGMIGVLHRDESRTARLLGEHFPPPELEGAGRAR